MVKKSLRILHQLMEKNLFVMSEGSKGSRASEAVLFQLFESLTFDRLTENKHLLSNNERGTIN